MLEHTCASCASSCQAFQRVRNQAAYLTVPQTHLSRQQPGTGKPISSLCAVSLFQLLGKGNLAQLQQLCQDNGAARQGLFAACKAAGGWRGSHLPAGQCSLLPFVENPSQVSVEPRCLRDQSTVCFEAELANKSFFAGMAGTDRVWPKLALLRAEEPMCHRRTGPEAP